MLRPFHAFRDIPEFSVVGENIVVGRHRLAEVTLALEVQGQVVNQLQNRFIHRQLAELVHRHVELALILKGESQQAVGVGRVGFGRKFQSLRGEKAPAGQQQMARQQQQGGGYAAQPYFFADHKVMTGADQGEQQHERENCCKADTHPGQDKHEIKHDDRKHPGLGRYRPWRAGVKILIQDTCDYICRYFGTAHGGTRRRDMGATRAGGRGADQHNFVSENLVRNLAGINVFEGIGGEGDIVAARRIKAGVHLHAWIGFYVELAHLNALAQFDLDIARSQVKTACRKQQGERGIVFAVVFQHQGFRAYPADLVLY